MASVVRRASLLVQLIFNFVRFSIVQRAGSWVQSHTKEKTKVTELKRKISTGDEDNFFDICSAPADEEESTISDRYDACKGGSRTVSSGKKLAKKKKSTCFKKKKVSPVEKLAWEKNGARGAEKRKGRAVSLFTSRSAKASNVKNDFDRPCYEREKGGKLSKAPSTTQGSGKEGDQVARQSADVSYSQQGTSKMQTGRNRRSEAAPTPGPSRRSCDEISEDRNFGSFKQKEHFGSPSGLRSKVAFKWQGFRPKKGKQTTTGISTRDSGDPSPTGLEANKKVNHPSRHRTKTSFRLNGFRGKRGDKTTAGMSTHDSEEPSPSGIKVKEEVNLPSSHRSKISMKWNGLKKRGRPPKLPSSTPPSPGTHDQSDSPDGSRSRITFKWNGLRGKKRGSVLKTGKPATDALHPGFGKLKKSLDRPNDLRSRISVKWEGLKRKKGHKSDKVKQNANSASAACEASNFPTGVDLNVDKCDKAVSGQCTLINRPTEATEKSDKNVTERIKKTSRLARLLSRFKKKKTSSLGMNYL